MKAFCLGIVVSCFFLMTSYCFYERIFNLPNDGDLIADLSRTMYSFTGDFYLLENKIFTPEQRTANFAASSNVGFQINIDLSKMTLDQRREGVVSGFSTNLGRNNFSIIFYSDGHLDFVDQISDSLIEENHLNTLPFDF